MKPRTITPGQELQQIAETVVGGAREITLPQAAEHAAIAPAQKYLAAAAESVNNALLTMRLSREFGKKMTGKDRRGRLHSSEMDMLRAAIVFAGAGLDATLKELIRSGLPRVAEISEHAAVKFQGFVAQHLGSPDGGLDRSSLAGALIAPSGPRQMLLEEYIDDLTGGSLQSAKQVDTICSALGITEARLRGRLKENGTLDQMFRARNEIVHEFDLTPTGSRSRTISQTEQWASEALSVAQEIINAVAALLQRWKPRRVRLLAGFGRQ